MRAFLFVLFACAIASADPADPPPCSALPDRSLPAIATKPAPAKQAKAARKIVEPMRDPDFIGFKQKDPECAVDSGDWRYENAIRRIFEAIDLDPSYVAARTALVDAIDMYLDLSEPDTAKRVRLRGWAVAALEQLRVVAWTGEPAALEFLARLKLRGALSGEPDVTAVMESLGSGGPSKLAQAATALLDAFWGEEAAWARARPYISPTAPIAIRGKTYRGEKGLGDWLLAENGGYPARGGVMGCRAGCCMLPFVDDRPHKLQVTKLCFDAQLKLRSVSRELSGM